MSKSLEALDVLYTHLENANQVVVVRECSLVYQTIKQDLERKEQLEKENQELKQDVKDVLEDYKDADLRMLVYAKVIDILKENVLIEFFEPQSEQEMHDCLNCGEEPYLIRLVEEWFTLEDYEKFNLLKKVFGNE